MNRLKSLFLSEHLILALCVVGAALASAFVPGFATWWNAQTLLLYGLPLLVTAVGLTFVLIVGEIDLSVTSIMALASVVGARVMSDEGGLLAGSAWAVPASLLVMLLAGAGLGALNGVFVAKFQIPSFISTLTMMMFVSGFAIWLTRSEKIGGLPRAFREGGQNLLLVLALVVALVALSQYFLSRSVYGRWLYMAGLNEINARISGVPTCGVVFSVFVASGIFAALGAILLTASLETGDPVMARNSLLDIVGATVLGGTSLHGGRGKAIWTVYGVVFLVLLDNSLNLLNVNYYFITLSKGGVILLAALLDSLRRRQS